MDFFRITHTDTKSRARTGVIHTAHGDIETPCFMPVGTQGTVKALDASDLTHLGAQIILGNTYHLHLRPGEEVIAKLGGLHAFMNWDKPLLTDSGGFQVFSLNMRTALRLGPTSPGLRAKNTPPEVDAPWAQKLRNTKKTDELSDSETSEHQSLVSVDNEGVTFRSHIDGSEHRFTPESAIEIQRKLGADIIMAFDEATPDTASFEYARQAMERTHRWAERCCAQNKMQLVPIEASGNKKSPDVWYGAPISQHRGNMQNYLFGIIQGAGHRELREESARFISSLPFDGIAIGGESIGYNMEATKNILDWIVPMIPEEKPRYTMGVGLSPSDLFAVVERGIDMFDCVAPTRMARNGTLYVTPQTKTELGLAKDIATVSITNARFRDDNNPIDPHCVLPGLEGYSRAYLHHLFKAKELLAYRLATIHNLHVLLSLMREMRMAIKEGCFLKLKKKWNVG